jgi:hypothetical protein
MSTPFISTEIDAEFDAEINAGFDAEIDAEIDADGVGGSPEAALVMGSSDDRPARDRRGRRGVGTHAEVAGHPIA